MARLAAKACIRRTLARPCASRLPGAPITPNQYSRCARATVWPEIDKIDSNVIIREFFACHAMG
jgi:hypothetical protein